MNQQLSSTTILFEEICPFMFTTEIAFVIRKKKLRKEKKLQPCSVFPLNLLATSQHQ